MKDRLNFKLSKNEKFIHSKLLDTLITESDIPKAVVEELYSELWYETLHGEGKISFKNNIQYTGHLKYGLLESTSETPSTLVFPNGTTYTGTMKANQITGEGTYTFPNGSTYTGEVLNGLRHGKGTFTSNNGITYEGEWLNGLKHGKGKIIQGNMTLEGTWDKGVISGYGRISWKNGNIYEGNCKDNLINGNGYMIWYNKNEKYTGKWKNNLQNGYGVHIWYEPKGEIKFLRDRYVGEWVNGKRCGYGRFYYSNGAVYEGYWDNNQKDGFGVMTYPDRTRYVGNFKEDRTVDNNALVMYMNAKKLAETNMNNQTITSMASNITKKASLSSRYSRMYIVGKQSANVNVNKKESNTNLLTKDNLTTIKESAGDSNSNTNTKTKEEGNGEVNVKLEKKKDRINKSLDEIKLQIDISDIQEMNPEINKATLKELDSILLRNLSFITHIYFYACGRISLKETADLATSIVSKSVATSETRSVFKNELNANKVDPQQQQQDDTVVDYDQIYNNDLYFCLDMQSLWKLFKELGLLSPTFTLANFNRFYYQNANNYIEMFYIPSELKDSKDEKVYDYLYSMIDVYKKDFDMKYKSQIEQFNILVGKPNITPLSPQDTTVNENDNNNNNNNSHSIETEHYNIHNGENIIMLRYFYELLIRVAYLKFNHIPNMPLETRVKNFFAYLKYYFKTKRKSPDTNSITVVPVLDIKLIKNWDTNLDTFISVNKLNLLYLYKRIYTNYINDNALIEKKYDMAITHKYFYEEVLLKTATLNEYVKDKMNYIGLITIYHKNKMVINQNDLLKKDVALYIEQLMCNEFIFVEFCEIVFIINRKYNIERKNKQEDAFDDVFELIKKSVCDRNGEIPFSYKYDYLYPKLKTHLLIEKLQLEIKERELIEAQKAKERERYEYERQRFIIEDHNMYKEEEEEVVSKSESYSEY